MVRLRTLEARTRRRVPPGRGATRGLLLVGLALFLTAADARSPAHPVGRFVVRYAGSARGLPPPREIEDLEVRLGRRGGRYVEPGPGDTVVRLRLDAVPPDPPPLFDASAIRSIDEQLVREFNRRGFAGVSVSPHPEDLGPGGAPPATLRLVVSVARVVRVRATALDGEGDPGRLRRIREDSPLQPGDPLREDRLRDHLERLNRHPGRAVSARLVPEGDAERVAIEYRLAEARPWSVYAQYSNTGTESTTPHRERVGFVHQQLTGADDVLRLDYVTGDLDEVHAVSASYTRPVEGAFALHRELEASWSRFDSSQLGFGDAFSGEQWSVQGRLVLPAFQRHALFLDLVTGLRFEHAESHDRIGGTSGSQGFLLPELGLRLERITSRSSLHARVALLRNLAQLTGTTTDDLTDLGRPGADPDFTLLRWDGRLSAPLPGSRAGVVPLHSLDLSLRGQYAFGAHLTPYHQRVVGGFGSVRGYPQSVTAGDGVVVGSLEYALHFAPLLPGPGGVQASPEMRALRAWDLILRPFLDGGRVEQSDPLPGETDATLLGAGCGLELLLRRSLSLRLDWGLALRDVEGRVKAGTHEVHVLATLLL